MRRHAILAYTAAFVVTAAVIIGCGSSYKLPTEQAGGVIPAAQSYQLLQAWPRLNGIRDILLTQGSGTQLFLLFNSGFRTSTNPGDIAPRGSVAEYFLTRPDPTGRTFNGLFNPGAMAVGGDGEGGVNNRIYILDRGDTCIAKFSPDSGRCLPVVPGAVDQDQIRDINHYWRVREYRLTGGDTLSTFTDMSMASVDGIAADAEGNVYVSGVYVSYVRDTQNILTFQRLFVDRIFKYSRGSRPQQTPPRADHRMPGARWHCDTTYVVSQGSGTGFVSGPRGMAWSAYGGGGLYVAEFGNNRGQKLDTVSPNGASFPVTGLDGPQPIISPLDVAVDEDGYIYVADTGNRHVVRHDPFGNYVQRVDNANGDGPVVVNPVGVAADDSLVYVADTIGVVYRYQRR